MKPVFKLTFLIAASWGLISLNNPLKQAVITAGLIIILGQRAWRRLKILLWPMLAVSLFQFWLRLPLTFGLKVANLSLLVFGYTQTATVREISQAFSFLPSNLGLTLTISLNLIPVIFQEAQKIRLVQISRGARSVNPLPLIIPLLHRTLQRSQQLTLILAVGKRGVEPPRA